MRHRPYFLRGPGQARRLPASSGAFLLPSAQGAGGKRPPQDARGTARRSAQPSLRTRAVSGTWRLSARHRGVFLTAPGRALPAVRLVLPSARRAFRSIGPRHAPGLGQTLKRPAVSQLLAGTRSGPGRSPGAARVRGYEPRPRAPQPPRISERPAETPLAGVAGRNIRIGIWSF